MTSKYVFFSIIFLILSSCQIPITIMASTTTEVSCGPMYWTHGDGDEKANKELVNEFENIGLVTTVDSSSYGEGSSCGGYLPMAYSFIITIINPRDASQTYLEQTSREVVNILFTTVNRSIEYYSITFIFPNEKLTCYWKEVITLTETPDLTHTCLFAK